jgi:hypothetical protein
MAVRFPHFFPHRQAAFHGCALIRLNLDKKISPPSYSLLPHAGLLPPGDPPHPAPAPTLWSPSAELAVDDEVGVEGLGLVVHHRRPRLALLLLQAATHSRTPYSDVGPAWRQHTTRYITISSYLLHGWTHPSLGLHDHPAGRLHHGLRRACVPLAAATRKHTQSRSGEGVATRKHSPRRRQARIWGHTTKQHQPSPLSHASQRRRARL